jgi:GxxExxY protein
MDDTIVYRDESYAILGACFEVYKEKGCGFLEAVYQECLEIELTIRDILFRPHPELTLDYKGQTLTQRYVPDVICYGKDHRRTESRERTD